MQIPLCACSICVRHMCESAAAAASAGGVCFFFLHATPACTSYHCYIMEECLGSFITEPGCSGDLGAGGPAQRAPLMLKR